jgi:hypothetical protein
MTLIHFRNENRVSGFSSPFEVIDVVKRGKERERKEDAEEEFTAEDNLSGPMARKLPCQERGGTLFFTELGIYRMGDPRLSKGESPLPPPLRKKE